MTTTYLVSIGATNLIRRSTETEALAEKKVLDTRFHAGFVKVLAVADFDVAAAGAAGVSVWKDAAGFLRAGSVEAEVEALTFDDASLDALLSERPVGIVFSE